MSQFVVTMAVAEEEIFIQDVLYVLLRQYVLKRLRSFAPISPAPPTLSIALFHSPVLMTTTSVQIISALLHPVNL